MGQDPEDQPIVFSPSHAQGVLCRVPPRRRGGRGLETTTWAMARERDTDGR